MAKNKDAPVRDSKKESKEKERYRHSDIETDRGRAVFQWIRHDLGKELEKERKHRSK